MARSILDWINRLPICAERCWRYSVLGLLLVFVGYSAFQYYQYEFKFSEWDILLLTAVVTFVVGLRYVRDIPVRFTRTILRLSVRGVLSFDQAKRESLKRELNQEANVWSRLIGIFAAVAMTIAFAMALSKDYSTPRALLSGLEVIGAYIAGNFLGQMAYYGQLGWLLDRKSVQIRVEPEHVDGVGGLKPIGDYYFFQAMVVAIPAIFLAVWWFLIPIWPRDYRHWQEAYLVLLVGAITLEVMAFFVPLWSFHKIMLREKRKLLEEADKISVRFADRQRSLIEAGQAQEQEGLARELEALKRRYWAIENMGTWPVDHRTQKRFGVNNLILFLPIASDLAKKTINWESVVKALTRFFSS